MIKIKILALIGSYRKNGHTSKVVSLLSEHLKKFASENGHKVEIDALFLGDYEINHCTGCRVCMDRGEEYCPLKDDIPILKAKIDNADGVIFASPVYVGDVSSAMKALIDRLAYLCHRQEFYDKCALILATTNATSLKRTIRTIGGATYSWGFKTVGTQGFKTETSMDSLETLKERYNKKIKKLASKLFSSVKEKSYLNPSIISLAAFRLQKKYHANPEIASDIDYNYWKEKGWIKEDKSYYLDVEVRPIKLFFSIILSGLFSLIF